MNQSSRPKKTSEKPASHLAQLLNPKQLFCLDLASLEQLYEEAYRLYHGGQYESASHLFRLLTYLDSHNASYPMGLAASLQMMGQWAIAIDSYRLCCSIDPNDPLPHFHLAHCYLQTGQTLLALSSLQAAIAHCPKGSQAHQLLRNRAQLMLASIQEQIGKPQASH